VRHTRERQEEARPHSFGLGRKQRPGACSTQGKSNEITAIPKLMNALELSGTVVTIDAMGCQRGIASRNIEKKADMCRRSRTIKDCSPNR
jgi:hypothetical protein